MRGKLKNLTVQVILGIVFGIIVGFLFPEFGTKLKVLADGFIKLIKMVITPIIFFTVVIGIGNMGDLKRWAASAARRSFILKLSPRLRWRLGLWSSILSSQGWV